jgi:hypothetical protein
VSESVQHAPQALVVSSNARARDDIIESLRAAKVGVVGTEHIDRCICEIPAGTSLVVLLPDDYRLDQVVGVLFALRRERPDVHAVLVTEAPERFARLMVIADNAPPPSIIQKPAPAWTILEAAARSAATDARRTLASGFKGGNRPASLDLWESTIAWAVAGKSE